MKSLSQHLIENLNESAEKIIDGNGEFAFIVKRFKAKDWKRAFKADDLYAPETLDTEEFKSLVARNANMVLAKSTGVLKELMVFELLDDNQNFDDKLDWIQAKKA